ncbi:acyl-CoA reductase [Pseudarthrobacter sp. ATCC 49987]|uniref:acyl-CoA reductase n=1 Tax=Pseudarthrobacter sp. ATCC 49987 TaxID=2698204 RepID=UPI00136DA176|nr:acyl-CoA reductase [Pseudarthrobacter sp. ATCC 49987]
MTTEACVRRPPAGGPVLDGFFLPQLSQAELGGLTWETRSWGGVALRMPVVTPHLTDLLCQRLLQAQADHLADRPVMDIVEALGRVIAKWANPDYLWRRQAEQLLPIMTGYAPEMVRRGLKEYLKTFRRDRLLRFLSQDFENPLVLDGFQPNRAGGRSRAYGPRLATQIFAGNVPGLPVWNLICGLLVKSATLGKSASGEPLFPVLFALSLAEEDPDLATCLAILHWPGGDEDIEQAAFNHSEAVTATGGRKAIESVAGRLPAGMPFVPYGHKMSFAVIGREALALNRYTETARRAARDASQYDQQGCLSPHCLFIERGGAVDPKTFAAALAAEMSRFERSKPRAQLTLEESAGIERIRSSYEFRAYDNKTIELFSSDTGTGWTVIYEEKPERFEPSPLNRLLRVHPVDGINDVERLAAPVRRYLQTAGVACSPERLNDWAQALGRCGVDRICAVGQMPEPAAGWHHDGRGNLTALVRWVDIEGAAEAELEHYDAEWTLPARHNSAGRQP